MDKPTIPYADFAKMDLRVGTVVGCEEIEGSEKLLKLTVDLGEPPTGGGKRTILSGIKKDFAPESLVGVQVLVLANLEPKKMMGLESQGMILMGVEYSDGVESKVTLLVSQNEVPAGTGVE